jgi:hypothetical protein
VLTRNGSSFERSNAAGIPGVGLPEGKAVAADLAAIKPGTPATPAATVTPDERQLDDGLPAGQPRPGHADQGCGEAASATAGPRGAQANEKVNDGRAADAQLHPHVNAACDIGTPTVHARAEEIVERQSELERVTQAVELARLERELATEIDRGKREEARHDHGANLAAGMYYSQVAPALESSLSQSTALNYGKDFLQRKSTDDILEEMLAEQLLYTRGRTISLMSKTVDARDAVTTRVLHQALDGTAKTLVKVVQALMEYRRYARRAPGSYRIAQANVAQQQIVQNYTTFGATHAGPEATSTATRTGATKVPAVPGGTSLAPRGGEAQ